MPGMDTASMAASAAADAGPLTLTPDNHMFHVLQGTKEVKVVLPATGAWTPDKPSSDLYSLADSTKAKLADGTDVEVFRFLMQKSGNATIVFTKSAGPADKAAETRTIMFMIH
jgi:UDP-N-acetylglucosamine 2-epimerase